MSWPHGSVLASPDVRTRSSRFATGAGGFLPGFYPGFNFFQIPNHAAGGESEAPGEFATFFHFVSMIRLEALRSFFGWGPDNP